MSLLHSLVRHFVVLVRKPHPKSADHLRLRVNSIRTGTKRQRTKNAHPTESKSGFPLLFRRKRVNQGSELVRNFFNCDFWAYTDLQGGLDSAVGHV